MTALFIVYAKISNAAQYALYGQAVMPVVQQYGGRAVARGRPPVVLEGDWGWQTAGVLEFPSMEAAQSFWASPEYAKVKTLRAGAAELQVIAVPGVPAQA